MIFRRRGESSDQSWFQTLNFAAIVVLLVATVVMAVPDMVVGLRGLPAKYRRAFLGEPRAMSGSLRTPSAGISAPASRNASDSLSMQLARLDQEIARIRQNTGSSRVDSMEAALRDLRATLFGDPTRALTLQRISTEQQALTARLDALASQMQWLFGISMTLALGVLATVVSVVKSSFERKQPDVPKT